VPDIGTITATLDMNVSRFDAGSKTAVADSQKVEQAITQMGDSATKASASMNELPAAMSKQASAAKDAAAAEQQLVVANKELSAAEQRAASDIANSNAWFDKQVAKANEAYAARQKLGTTTTQVAAAEKDLGQSFNASSGAGSRNVNVMEKVEEKMAHVGAHVLGANRQLASLTKYLPEFALGGLAVVGAVEAGSMVLEKAIDIADDWSTSALKGQQAWEQSSRKFADDQTNALNEVAVVRAKGAHDLTAEADATYTYEVTKARQAADAQIKLATDAAEAEKHGLKAMLPSWEEVGQVGVRAIATIAQAWQAMHGQAAAPDQLLMGITIAEQREIDATKHVNEVRAAAEQAANNKSEAERVIHEARLEDIENQRLAHFKAIENDTVHAEADAASTRLGINKDVMEKLKADETESIRMINARGEAEKEAAKIEFKGQKPEEKARLDQVLLDIDRETAAKRDKIYQQSAENQIKAARDVNSAAGDIFRELGPGFEDLAKKADISESLSHGADQIKVLREQFKITGGNLGDFAKAVDEIQYRTVKMGASWEQAGKMVDAESKRMIGANREYKDSVAEIDGVYTNLTGSTKTYVQTTSQVVSGSSQVTEAYQKQATAVELINEQYKNTSQAERQVVEGAQGITPAMREATSATANMGERLGDAAKAGEPLRARLEQIDDSMRQTVEGANLTGTAFQRAGTAAENMGERLGDTAKDMSSMATSATQLGPATDKAVAATNRLGTSSEVAAAEAKGLTIAYGDQSKGINAAIVNTNQYDKSVDDLSTSYTQTSSAADFFFQNMDKNSTVLLDTAKDTKSIDTANQALTDSNAQVSASMDAVVEKSRQLADNYERAAKAARDLEGIQTQHSLDDSMLSVASATDELNTSLGKYVGQLDDATSSAKGLLAVQSQLSASGGGGGIPGGGGGQGGGPPSMPASGTIANMQKYFADLQAYYTAMGGGGGSGGPAPESPVQIQRPAPRGTPTTAYGNPLDPVWGGAEMSFAPYTYGQGGGSLNLGQFDIAFLTDPVKVAAYNAANAAAHISINAQAMLENIKKQMIDTAEAEKRTQAWIDANVTPALNPQAGVSLGGPQAQAWESMGAGGGSAHELGASWGLSGTGVGTGGFGTTVNDNSTNTVNVNGITNPQQVAQAVIDKMNEMQRRRGLPTYAATDFTAAPASSVSASA
jgi:hypothetical protein